MPKNKKVVCVYLDDETITTLKKISQEKEQPISWLVKNAIKQSYRKESKK